MKSALKYYLYQILSDITLNTPDGSAQIFLTYHFTLLEILDKKCDKMYRIIFNTGESNKLTFTFNNEWKYICKNLGD